MRRSLSQSEVSKQENCRDQYQVPSRVLSWRPLKYPNSILSELEANGGFSQRTSFDSHSRRMTLSVGLMKDCMRARWQLDQLEVYCEDLARD